MILTVSRKVPVKLMRSDNQQLYSVYIYVSQFQIIVKGTVFARMSPDQKAQLIEALQDVG